MPSSCPRGTGPTRDWPRLAFIAFKRGRRRASRQADHQLPVGGIRVRTASAAALDAATTVYCLTPLHHESALLVSLGGAVVGGTASHCRAGCAPTGSSRRYGSMASPWCPTPGHAARRRGRSGIRTAWQSPGAAVHRLGMRPIVERIVDAFAPARVVEFFATTDGQAVLANVAGAKVGSKGRPLPGAGRIELAAYDTEHDLIQETDRGFVQARRGRTRSGCCLPRPRAHRPDRVGQTRVFAPATPWVSTENLFRRDEDGD